MGIDVITQLIGSMGFPIACVVAMFYYWNKEREDHKQEIERMTEDVNNNTQALIQLQVTLQK